jgi:hypothetical protein
MIPNIGFYALFKKTKNLLIQYLRTGYENLKVATINNKGRQCAEINRQKIKGESPLSGPCVRVVVASNI